MGGSKKGGKGHSAPQGWGAESQGWAAAVPSDQERRVARKAGRRSAQLEKMDEKQEADSNYFWECKAKHSRQGKGSNSKGGEEGELFERQGTFAINFAKYDEIEVKITGPGAELAKPLVDLQDMGNSLPSFLARNVALMRYRVPTPIQKHAIPLALNNRDLMCCAQTGSGKTAAFLLPVVAALGKPGRRKAQQSDGPDDPALPRCVVMAPTRELTQQIHVEALKMCHQSGLKAVVVYGGAQARQQLAELAQGCDIVVATPGRLTDFVDKGMVALRLSEYLVLDEADRMLDMGFEPQIRQLVQRRDMPEKTKRQTLLFSATFPPEIQKLAAEFLNQHLFIAVGRVGGTTENIEQRLVLASSEKRQKFELLLKQLIDVPGQTMVFVQKKRVAAQVKKWLVAQEIWAEEIHGDRSQSQRESALAAFRTGTCRVLCATDVAARGLDIPRVAHVINFDLPTSPDEFDAYVHRIGRTGRAGNTGISTSFYVPGRDPKVGNAGIADALVKLFDETKNPVPEWFLELPEGASIRRTGQGKATNNPAAADVRQGQAVKARVRPAQVPAEPVPEVASFQNAVSKLLATAQKQGSFVSFEEQGKDLASGNFWCEVWVVAEDGITVMAHASAQSSKKKDAKHDASEKCLAALLPLIDSTANGTGAVSQKTGNRKGAGGGGRGKGRQDPAEDGGYDAAEGPRRWQSRGDARTHQATADRGSKGKGKGNGKVNGKQGKASPSY